MIKRLFLALALCAVVFSSIGASPVAAAPAPLFRAQSVGDCSWTYSYFDHGMWFELILSHCAAQKLITGGNDGSALATLIATVLSAKNLIPQSLVITVATALMQFGFYNRVRDNDHGAGVNLSSLKWNAPFPFLWAINPR